MQLSLPSHGHLAGRSRHRLIERVVVRRSQRGPLEELLRLVVPEPVLARLVALDDRVSASSGVATCMLRWGRVATADVAAVRAAAQVEPPAAGREAFDAARPARGNC